MSIKFDVILGKLRDQDILTLPDNRFFADSAARDAAITSPQEGEFCAVLVSGQTYYILQEYESGSWEDRIQIARGPRGENGDPTVLINDAVAGTDTTYSSTKIEEEFTAVTQLINSINPQSGDEYIFIQEGNSLPTDNGNWKIEIENGLLTFTRRESNVWVQKGVFGNSLITDEIFLEDTFPQISVTKPDGTVNLIRKTQSLLGTDVGDLTSSTFISTNETVRQSKLDQTLTDHPLQPLGGEIFSGPVLDFTLDSQNFGKLTQVDFECDNPNGRLQVKVYRDSARTKLAYFSEQDEDFINGAGMVLHSGMNSLDLSSRPLYFSTVNPSYVRVSALTGTGATAVGGDLSVIGSTIQGQFIPKMMVSERTATIENLATENYVMQHLSTTSSISDFSINIARRVDLDTDLNIAHTVSFNVHNHEDVSSLALQLNGSTVATLTTPTSNGQQSQQVTLSGINTSSETTLVFRLLYNGTNTTNSQTVSVRDLPQSETVYAGVSNSNNPGTVDVSTLTAHEVSSNTNFRQDFTLNTNDWAIILYPANYTITGILENTFNQQILNDFTGTNNVRSINTQTYNSLVHQNVANSQGILSTTINVEV